MRNFMAGLLLFILLLMVPAVAPGENRNEVLVLCYHSVTFETSPDDEYSLPQNKFAEQMEYLRTHGYNPVSLSRVIDAGHGKAVLPDKPVLLTFDDAYISYYEFVLPLLEKLHYPSVLAVVGKFIDDPLPIDPLKGLPEPLMNWDQLREVSRHELVDVVSHSYDLHKGIQYNPAGNVAPAVNVMLFDKTLKKYESKEEYRRRISEDFNLQNKLFKKQLGFSPKVLVWPFGKYNEISLETAKEAGYEMTFNIEGGYADVKNPLVMKRNIVKNKPVESFLITESPIDDFIEMVTDPDKSKLMIRAVQVDLDLIYDPDSFEQMDRNLGILIDRLVEMKVNTVFLQAFADPEGSGNIKSVYFQNRVLPVRADIFSHALHQLAIRDMTVYAWMPTLSIELPDREMNQRLKVRAVKDGSSGPGTSWYKRLTPFSRESVNLVKMLYEDLASHAQIHGVLFQDDAYLTDKEDFHPAAISRYKEEMGKDMLSESSRQDPELEQNWARLKTEVLIDFTRELMASVRKFRPDAAFARNLYSVVINEPVSELWFAQNYPLFLENYDSVVIMAYPQMDRVSHPDKWLRNIVNRAKEYPRGLDKTIFKVQTYDWRKKEWIIGKDLLKELREILMSGGKHIAYYPDNFWLNQPPVDEIKLEMSTEIYPFLP